MRPTLTATGAAACLGLLVVCLLAACGPEPTVTVQSSGTAPSTGGLPPGATPSAKTVVQQTRSAYASATSAHLRATSTGQTGSLTIDIRGTVDGSNQEVTITDPTKGSATFRTVDGKDYFKADLTFWRASLGPYAAAAESMADKWVAGPPVGSPGKTTMRSILDGIIGPERLTDGDLDRATIRASSHGSSPVWQVDARGTTTLKISADATHNLLHLTGPGRNGRPTSADLDGWNAQPRFTAPQVSNISPGRGGPKTA